MQWIKWNEDAQQFETKNQLEDSVHRVFWPAQLTCEKCPNWRRVAKRSWDDATDKLSVELTPVRDGFSPLQRAMWAYLNLVWLDPLGAADKFRKDNPEHPLIALVDLLVAEPPVVLPANLMQYLQPSRKTDVWRVISIAPDGSWSVGYWPGVVCCSYWCEDDTLCCDTRLVYRVQESK